MDINALTSAYTNYADTLTGSQTSKSAASISALENKDLKGATDEELMDVCKEFESYFLEQVMKEMTKTIGDEDSESSSSSMVDYFKDTTLQSLAKESTEQNSLGLAQTLFDQMKRNMTSELI